METAFYNWYRTLEMKDTSINHNSKELLQHGFYAAWIELNKRRCNNCFHYDYLNSGIMCGTCKRKDGLTDNWELK